MNRSLPTSLLILSLCPFLHACTATLPIPTLPIADPLPDTSIPDTWFDESPATRTAAAALNRPLPLSLTPSDTLEFAFRTLADSTGVQIITDWPQLQSIGLLKTTPLPLRLQNLSASRALAALLQRLSADSATPIGYIIQEGTLQISTQLHLDTHHKVTRTYDIRDLLLYHTARNEPLFVGSGPSRNTPPFDQKAYDAIADSLLLTIAAAAPNTWISIAGKPATPTPSPTQIGTLREFDGTLLVTHTPARQRAVAQLIAQMRAAIVQITCDAHILDTPFSPEDIAKSLPANPSPSGNLTTLSDSAFATLLTHLAANPSSSAHKLPRVTLFTGNTLNLAELVSPPEQGESFPYILTLRPTVSPDHTRILTQLNVQFFTSTTGPANRQLSFSSTPNLPLDSVTLLELTSTSTSTSTPHPRHLYLAIRLHIITDP